MGTVMEVEWASADPAHLQISYNQLEGRFKQLQGKKSRRRREVRLRSQRSQQRGEEWAVVMLVLFVLD